MLLGRLAVAGVVREVGAEDDPVARRRRARARNGVHRYRYAIARTLAIQTPRRPAASARHIQDQLKLGLRRADESLMIGSDVTASMEAPMVLDLLPVGVAVIDVYGTLRFANAWMLAMTGFSSDDVVGRSVLDFVPSEEFSNATEILAAGRGLHRPDDGADPPALPGRRRPAPGDRDVGAELSRRGRDRRLRGDVRRGVGERPHVACVRVDLERRPARADPAGGDRLDGGAPDGGDRGRGVAGPRRALARR